MTKRMDADAFLLWCLDQEERYELVDGAPTMMGGARARHDRVTVSTLVTLKLALKGTPCEPFSGDFAVRIPAGNIRRPDVTVDCGGTDLDRLEAVNPVLVVEVLSPSTRSFDMLVKVGEYQTVPSVRHILLIEARQAKAVLHSRTPDGGWTSLVLPDRDAVVPLDALSLALPLSAFTE